MGTRQYVEDFLTTSTGAVDTAAAVARAAAVEEGGVLRDDALDQME